LDALEKTQEKSGTSSSKKGKAFDIHPAGMIALDIARIEAGLILIEVDYTSSKKSLDRRAKIFSGGNRSWQARGFWKKTISSAAKPSPAKKKNGGWNAPLIGLEINWNEVEALYDKLEWLPRFPASHRA